MVVVFKPKHAFVKNCLIHWSFSARYLIDWWCFTLTFIEKLLGHAVFWLRLILLHVVQGWLHWISGTIKLENVIDYRLLTNSFYVSFTGMTTIPWIININQFCLLWILLYFRNPSRISLWVIAWLNGIILHFGQVQSWENDQYWLKDTNSYEDYPVSTVHTCITINILSCGFVNANAHQRKENEEHSYWYDLLRALHFSYI